MGAWISHFKADSNFACVSCAFHGSLISQLRNSLLENGRRVATTCLVCQSSDSILLEMQQVEGAHQALSHPVLEVKSSIIRLATPARKVCNSCAYALQWLYKQSLKIYVKKPQLESSRRTVKVEKKTVEKEEVSSRSKRTAAVKVKVEPPPSPPARPSRRASVLSNTSKQTNGKQSASRTSKKAYKEDSDTEDSDNEDSDTEDSDIEEPVKKKPSRLVPSIKPKHKASEVLSVTRSSRKVVAPERFQITETKAVKVRPTRASNRENNESKSNTSSKRSVPERLIRQAKRQATNELVEYECDKCSQMFYSGVTAGLHNLEHEGRYFTLELERCATPVYNDSASSMEEMEDEGSSSGESKRKPRKPEKPVKNAARDRLNREADADGNFVFVAPLRVSCPKSVKERTNEKEVINFGFEKPISVNPEEKENEFSDDEEESGTENVDNCISSLENSETLNKSSDEEKGKAVTENGDEAGETKETSEAENNVSQSTSEEQSPVRTNINQVLSFDFEPPQVVSNCSKENSNKSSEEQSVTKSNCLKFDFEEPVIPTVKSDPPKTISSALCFDYDPPENISPPRKLCDKLSPSKIMAPVLKGNNDKHNDSGSSTYLSTENDFPNDTVSDDLSSAVESDTYMNAEDRFTATTNSENMLSTNIDTSNALRDDSTNPTLPQSQQDSSFSLSSPEQNVADLASLEKMVSQV